jgi:hypothetical protein
MPQFQTSIITPTEDGWKETRKLLEMIQKRNARIALLERKVDELKTEIIRMKAKEVRDDRPKN